jgi:hypothetical protein
MKKVPIIFISALIASFTAIGQDSVPKEKIYNTFNGTRVINMNSVEVLEKRQLDVRITHRFGDMATKGAEHTFFGIENVADTRIAFEYGICNDVTIAFARLKGVGIMSELLEGSLKYRLLQQTNDNSTPVSVTLLGNTVYSARIASTDSTSGAYFQSGTDRLSYLTQIMIAKKFSERLSIQITPTFFHRNFVAAADNNSIFALGAGFRYQISKNSGLIFEGFSVFDDTKTEATGYYLPIAIGYEIGTGGHIFQINLTNSRGIIENEFLAENNADIGKGEFRLGFTISRKFGL